MARPYRAMRWRAAQPDPAACLLLCRAHGILPVTAQILYNRGLTSPEAVEAFLRAGRSQIHDPFLLKDMDRAVALVRRQIAAGRSIMVYGDYDVDGITGTTILVLALRALGAQVSYYIPDRFTEGYGLNAAALTEIGRRGFDFVLSVDTGVTAVAEAEVARSLGITLVVSDHHEPGPELPAAAALINPKRRDCTYPFKGLSGVGVAFKLALALEAPNAWDLLDIVTLGTIADMVPLVGENRAIVREGLGALGNTRRVGLRSLMEIAGVREPITATHIGFALGPRINALGRMGSAMKGVDLLTTDDKAAAEALARHLDDENRARREVEAAMLQDALAQAEQLPPHLRSHVLVVAGEGWHHGVVGICASKVMEVYHRPTILLAIDGEQVRGSARSIPAFHMHQALLQVSDLFAKFGGHAAAAGMTLKRKEDVTVLRERLNHLAAQRLRPEDLVPQLTIDAQIGLVEVNDRLLAELQALEPYGIGNPSPVLAVGAVAVAESRTMGKEQQHLRLSVTASGVPFPMDAVGWSMAPARPAPRSEAYLAFYPEVDSYQGRSRLRLTLKDLKAAGTPDGLPVSCLTPAHCIAWDPLFGLGVSQPARVTEITDAREHRLSKALAALDAPMLEVAATVDQEQPEAPPEPTRLLYLTTLAKLAGRRILVLTASPWAAVALADELPRLDPALRPLVRLWLPGEPEPGDGTVVVSAYGTLPFGAYTDTALLHPPYYGGQVVGKQVHLLWEPHDWTVGAASLGWAYPEREDLVLLYKQMRTGPITPEALATATGEVFGPWTHARLEAGLSVFRELGLLTVNGLQTGVRFDLQNSPRYLRGQAGRMSLADSQANDWPAKSYAI